MCGKKKGNKMSIPLPKEQSFSDFMKKNKEKIYETGRNNTKLNQDGLPTISKEDPWFKEDEWDDHFERMDK
jgi:hypothetical protein